MSLFDTPASVPALLPFDADSERQAAAMAETLRRAGFDAKARRVKDDDAEEAYGTGSRLRHYVVVSTTCKRAKRDRKALRRLLSSIEGGAL